MGNKNWYTLAHLSGLLGPIGVAIVWLLKYKETPPLQPYIRSAFNFQLVMFLVALIISKIPNVGWTLPFIVALFSYYHAVKGALKAGEGYNYKYPYSFEFIK